MSCHEVYLFCKEVRKAGREGPEKEPDDGAAGEKTAYVRRVRGIERRGTLRAGRWTTGGTGGTVHRVGTVLLVINIPLLIGGAHCLDLIERKKRIEVLANLVATSSREVALHKKSGQKSDLQVNEDFLVSF